jgi:protein-S-isoprenylcysteine O-methyltransferase Ste14
VPRTASALFVLVGPGLELVAGPWVLTGLHVGDDLPAAWPLRVLGGLLLVAGVAVLADAFVRFAREGQGSPSPLYPTRRLVVSGVYRHLRHPMYVATTAAIAGEGLLLRQPILLGAAAAYGLTLAALVRWWEEPLLRRRFRGYDQR